MKANVYMWTRTAHEASINPNNKGIYRLISYTNTMSHLCNIARYNDYQLQNLYDRALNTETKVYNFN